MRLKLDENLPVMLIGKLADLGHDVDTVPAEQFASRPHAEVWDACQRTQRFLITQHLVLL
jgi:hypothetical protein